MALDGRDIEEKNTERRAQILGLRYLDVRTLVRQPLYKGLIPDDYMQAHQVVPIAANESALTIGITTMTPPDVLDSLRQVHSNKRVRYVLISATALKEYFALYNPPPKTVYKDIEIGVDTDQDRLQIINRDLKHVTSEDLLAYIVNQAFKLEASDIHCENRDKEVLLRMRIHGVLHPVVLLDHEQYRILLNAIASAADISTSSQEAQTGHIAREHAMKDGLKVVMNFRVETIPTVFGMDIVMRFFSFSEDNLVLGKLGMKKEQIEIINKIIKYPKGLVLIVGPTGSGKSTTLYTLIHELAGPQLKIITLEEPVEYQLKGITQIPVNSAKGTSFASGLRTVLRFDPDVIALGEIRDEDTFQTALKAALTGHLVLSTYHAATITLALITLLKITTDDPLFLNAIRLIQSQRLVRRLDDQTKIAYRPSEIELSQIEKILQTMPANSRPQLPSELKLYKPGLSEANPFGFSGRIAIREFLIINDDLSLFLLKSGLNLNPSDLEKELVRRFNFKTMLHEGIEKVLAGETTLEELYRAGV